MKENLSTFIKCDFDPLWNLIASYTYYKHPLEKTTPQPE